MAAYCLQRVRTTGEFWPGLSYLVVFSYCHQYPTLSSTGTPRRRASSNAASDQGHQSTAFLACRRGCREVS